MKYVHRIGEKNVNTFGSEMVIQDYRRKDDIDVYFPKYDWLAIKKEYRNFQNGNIKCPYEPRMYGIGYIGEGEYQTKDNGKFTSQYVFWKSMMTRCYNTDFHYKEPKYIDCSVSTEWFNFQCFAQWYEENYYEIPNELMNLDKDILYKNNRIYSPKNCIFVPMRINTLFVRGDKMRGEYPIGVSYDKKTNKFSARCRIGNNKKKHLGLYSTPTEAFIVYKNFKESYIKQVADEYKELIPIKLYNAMYKYEVSIDD